MLINQRELLVLGLFLISLKTVRHSPGSFRLVFFILIHQLLDQCRQAHSDSSCVHVSLHPHAQSSVLSHLLQSLRSLPRYIGFQFRALVNILSSLRFLILLQVYIILQASHSSVVNANLFRVHLSLLLRHFRQESANPRGSFLRLNTSLSFPDPAYVQRCQSSDLASLFGVSHSFISVTRRFTAVS